MGRWRSSRGDGGRAAPPARYRRVDRLSLQLGLAVFGVVAATAVLLLWTSNGELAAAYKEEGRATALAIGTSFASDFRATDLDRPVALRERLTEMRTLNPSLRKITVYRREGSLGVRVASTARGALGPVDAHDTKPIATGRSEYVEERAGGEHVGELTFPLEDRVTGERVAAIGLYLDLAPLDAQLSTRTRRLTVAAVLVAALLATIMLLVLGRTVLRPLDRLRLATRRITSGQLDVRLGWKRSDAIGALSRDFDEMAQEIQASHDSLRDLALHDPLTGLLNHRATRERLDVEIARARRDDRSLSVVVLDIDYFKGINDRHGHAAGDEALRLVARAIVGTLRPADFCGRVGGDEFIVVLYGVDARQAAEVVSRIRVAVAAVEVRTGGDHLTISAGIAEFPGHAASSAELTQLADGALYWSKRTGRDRQSLYSPQVAAASSPQDHADPAHWDGEDTPRTI